MRETNEGTSVEGLCRVHTAFFRKRRSIITCITVGLTNLGDRLRLSESERLAERGNTSYFSHCTVPSINQALLDNRHPNSDYLNKKRQLTLHRHELCLAIISCLLHVTGDL
jgi:hypothetical protein